MTQRAVYISTKPQEYITCRTIAEEQNNEEKNFVLVRLFQGVDTVASNIKAYDKLWDRFEVYDKYIQALDFAVSIKANIIYLDCDVGYKRFIQLFKLKRALPEIKIYVYEEGIGVNRDDYKSGFKRLLFKILGVGVNYGGSKFTQGIFVYSEKNYRTEDKMVPCEVIEIGHKYGSYISKNIEFFYKIFQLDEIDIALNSCKESTQDIALYLSDWEVDFNFSIVEYLRSIHPYLLIKIHPRSSMASNDLLKFKISAFVPAELVILLARKQNFRVNVYSAHKSTVEYYLSDIEVVNEVYFCRI